MTIDQKFANVIDRVAAYTSIARTRSQDAERREVHGGSADDLRLRVEAVVERLEKAASDLERSIA